MSKKGFTLIELLIVVAIIAILAAIAVPNFLEAQTRAKVSRTKNDLRTQAVALESYYVDYNSYTRDSDSSLDLVDVGDAAADTTNALYYNCANGARQLTTPVAYMSSLLSDPFAGKIEVEGAGAQGYRIGSGSWSYPDVSINSSDNQNSTQVFAQVGKRACFVTLGVGPDQNRCRIGYKCFPFFPAGHAKEGPDAAGGDPNALVASKNQPGSYIDYDPTNGTVSLGDIYRFGGSYGDGRWVHNGQVIGGADSPGGAVW